MNVSSKIVMKKINEVKPYIRNPRKNDKTVEKLIELIPKVGFNVPLVIDENGIIVKGHSRYKAAIKLGMQELPCIVSTAGEEANKLDRISDNRVSEFSEWIDEALSHEIDMIDLDCTALEFPVPDISDMGFDFEEETDEDDVSEISQEERLEKFKQMQAQAPVVQITTPEKIQKAQEVQEKPQVQEPEYYRCMCEKCGHVTFITKGNLIK